MNKYQKKYDYLKSKNEKRKHYEYIKRNSSPTERTKNKITLDGKSYKNHRDKKHKQ